MNGLSLSLSDVEKAVVSIDDIYLDIDNPRFYGVSGFELFNPNDVFSLENQEILRQYIVKKYGANEIVESILSVGFLPIDYIVLEKIDERYIVVEGNRRIAAIKTILGDFNRKEIQISDEILNGLVTIEALSIKKSGDIDKKKWILQGIRHVSGVRGWGPYQQAKLISELHDRHKMTFKEIGRTIGVHYNRVSTMLRAYYALEQMKSDENYKEFASADLFSHFEQAYIKTSIRDWLSWDDTRKEYSNANALYKFYDMITGRNNSTPLMSKNIRDDLPLIVENNNVLDLFVDNKIALDAAKNMIAGSTNSSSLIGLLEGCFKQVSEKKSNIGLTAEECAMIQKINTLVSC